MNIKSDAKANFQESSTTLYLLRHGECEGGRIFRGRSDVALLPEGAAAMQQALDKLAPSHYWHSVISSPLKRCKNFAENFCEQHKLPLELEPKLREIDFGTWDGKPIDDVWREDQSIIELWSQDPSSVTPPEGEPLQNAQQRVSQLLTEVNQKYKNQQLLIITHGGIIRLILGAVLNMPLSAINRFDVPYACLSQVVLYQSAQRQFAQLVAHNLFPTISIPTIHTSSSPTSSSRAAAH